MSSGPPPIAQLTGPLLLGHFFNWGLYGCLLVQTYIYYLAFPQDRKLPKILVCLAVGLETLQTILATRDAFRDFATGWGNEDELNAVGWLWFSVPVMGALITSTTQFFFAWRIWILSNKLYIPIPVVMISTLQCIFGCWVGVRAHIVGVFSKVQTDSNSQTAVWLGGTAICDFIIAISMIYYLSRSRTGFRSTNILITKIIRITIETGLICAAFAVLDLSFFLRWKFNNYHLAPSIALSKLYSNSLLVVLNARVRIIGGRGTTDSDFTSMASGAVSSTNQGKISRSTAVNMLTITSHHVDNEEITMTDTIKGTVDADPYTSRKAGTLV